MNWRHEIISIGIILLLATIAWLVAYLDHKNTSSSSWEAIYLPKIVGIPFGGLWLKTPFNIRGIVLQLLMYIVTLVLILSAFGFISPLTRGRCIGVTSIVLSIMGLAYYYYKKDYRG